MPIESPRRIRTSERRDFKRCQLRWNWAWRGGLTPIGPPATNLWFGIGAHLALAEWYKGPGLKRGRDPRDTWNEYCKDEYQMLRTEKYAGADWTEDEFVEAEELGIAMFTGYLELYGRDDSWHVIAPEYTFEVNIRSRMGIPFKYNGTFDLVYRDLRDDRIKLGEHKTYKQIRTNHLPLDEQTTGYQYAADNVLRKRGLLRRTDRIDGITYNILRKALPDPRPKNSKGEYLNKNGSVSKMQPSPYFVREFVEHTPREQWDNIRRLAVEMDQMEILRTSKDLITKTPTIDCSWDCPFNDMCQLHQMGSDWREFRDAMYNVQDPYLDHRYNQKSTGS